MSNMEKESDDVIKMYFAELCIWEYTRTYGMF